MKNSIDNLIKQFKDEKDEDLKNTIIAQVMFCQSEEQELEN